MLKEGFKRNYLDSFPLKCYLNSKLIISPNYVAPNDLKALPDLDMMGSYTQWKRMDKSTFTDIQYDTRSDVPEVSLPLSHVECTVWT